MNQSYSDIDTIKQIEFELGNKLETLKYGEKNKTNNYYSTIKDKENNIFVVSISLHDIKEIPLYIYNFHFLRQLSLANCNISDFDAPLEKLTSLEYLDLSNNNLCKFPKFHKSKKFSIEKKETEEVYKIKTIILKSNKISHIPVEISQMDSLISINLENNIISEIPGYVSENKNLQYLNLGSNRIKALFPRIITSNLDIIWEKDSKFGVILCNNPLISPPIEIVKQGKKSVKNYFDSMNISKGVAYLYEAKLLILGFPKVGKTSLMKKLLNNDYNVKINENTTRGIEINKFQKVIHINNKEVLLTINIWDFGGQEIYHATHQFFLTKRSLYLMVWEPRSVEITYTFDYWLNIIKLLSNESPTLMIMNKRDEDIVPIEEENIRKLFPNVKNFYKISALKGIGIVDLMTDIEDYVLKLDHIGNPLPAEWTDVREKLKSINKDYISYNNYEIICKDYGLDHEKSKYLAEYYHDLGVFLHFSDDVLLQDLIILNPEWNTKAVYDVLSSLTIKENYGRFNIDILKSIWINYPIDKYPHLIRLMERFELCFKIGNANDYILPELMHADRPVDELSIINDNNCIKFIYTYEFMPAGIMIRFIVRQHMNIYKNIVWKNGVVLKYDNTIAKVIAYPMQRKIEIKIEGPNKIEALAVIRNELKNIHSYLNNPKVNELIPCNCIDCRDHPEPKYFNYQLLSKYTYEGWKEIDCDNGKLKKVKVEQLLNGFISTKNRDDSYQVFISYSSKDKMIIKKIVDVFNKLNISYWWDNEQIEPGDFISDSIESGLSNSKFIMPCLSKNQLQSGWSRHEYSVILSKVIQKSTHQRIIPLILDDLPYSDIPLNLSNIKCKYLLDRNEYIELLKFLIDRK